MALELFPFTPSQESEEDYVRAFRQTLSTNQVRRRNSRTARSEFQARWIIQFGKFSNDSYGDLRDFWERHSGPVLPFLIRPAEPDHRTVRSATIGTGDDTKTVFAFSEGTRSNGRPLHKHIDASTLRVYIDGSLQASGWSLSNNGTDPTITFTVAPGLGLPITVDYEHRIPVLFDDERIGGGGMIPGKDIDTPNSKSVSVDLVESSTGARYAT